MLLPIHNLNFWVCIRLIFSSNAQIGKDGKVKTHIHLLIYPSIVWCDLKLYFQMSLKAFEGTNVLFNSIKNENDQHYWKKKRKEQNTFTQRRGERNHFSTFRWWAYAFLSAIMKPFDWVIETLFPVWAIRHYSFLHLEPSIHFFSFLLKGNIQYWLNKPPSVLYLLGLFWM